MTRRRNNRPHFTAIEETAVATPPYHPIWNQINELQLQLNYQLRQITADREAGCCPLGTPDPEVFDSDFNGWLDDDEASVFILFTALACLANLGVCCSMSLVNWCQTHNTIKKTHRSLTTAHQKLLQLLPQTPQPMLLRLTRIADTHQQLQRCYERCLATTDLHKLQQEIENYQELSLLFYVNLTTRSHQLPSQSPHAHVEDHLDAHARVVDSDYPIDPDFRCPISQLLIATPVCFTALRRAQHNTTYYDRTSLTEWITACRHRRQPVTDPLTRTVIKPPYTLHLADHAYTQRLQRYTHDTAAALATTSSPAGHAPQTP